MTTLVLKRLATCLLIAAIGGAPGSAQELGVLAHYAFDDGLAEGIDGRALELDGEEGLEIFADGGIDLAKPYSLEMWVWVDKNAAGQPMTLASKEGELLLRLDRPGVGGTIAYYPHIGGNPEPRVMSIIPGAERWHHVLASWDGKVARLFVDGIMFDRERPGEAPTGGAPLMIGAPTEFAPGFVGRIDELRVWQWPIGPRVALRRALRVDDTDESAPMGAGIDLDLDVTHPHDQIVWRGLDFEAEGHPSIEVTMASDGGAGATLLYATSEGAGQASFLVNPDGAPHRYEVDMRRCPDWRGEVEALALRPSDVAGASAHVRSLRPLRADECAPMLHASALRPQRGWLAAGESVAGEWLLRNDGPTRLLMRLDLRAIGGESELLTPPEVNLAPGEEHIARWRATADDGESVRVAASVAGNGTRRTRACELRVAEAAGAFGRAIDSLTRAGFPRAMDFRHLGPGSASVHGHNQVLLVDLIGEKIAAARDFKRRFPDRLVLMQVNDEPNGTWGSWFTVTSGFALKEGLRHRPDVFPSETWPGHWLMSAGGTLRSAISDSQAALTVDVDHAERFEKKRFGKPVLPDVLIYARPGDIPDFTRANYATVTAVDADAGTVTLERWPEREARPWLAFEAGEAYVAPSCGDIYGMLGKTLKTWLPNLTKHCPRHPETGLTAAEAWAEHFATLWRDRIAAGDGPVPDGYQFDWATFEAHNPSADCDNDGAADGCELNGVSYWALGMHDFFVNLRAKLGDEVLLLADSGSPNSPRGFDVLNGSENEEFPAFGDYRLLSAQLDLHLYWCREAREPRISYLQSRFPCELYGADRVGTDKYRPSSRLRMNAAAACMGFGVHTYRDGLPEEVSCIVEGGGDVEFDLDEHHAGDEGGYGWLGLPVEEPRRIDVAGEELLTVDAAGWELAQEGHDADAETSAVEHTFGDDAPTSAREADVTGLSPVSDPAAGLGGWTGHRLRRMWAARLLSPPVGPTVESGEEVVLTMWLDADPQNDDIEGERYAAFPREVGFRLEQGDALGPMQTVLAGPKPRRLDLTLTAPATGHPRLAVGVGCELGPVWVGGVRLRRGCAEVLARRFEAGAILMNGSQSAAWEFDLPALFPDMELRRIRGSQSPQVNTGEALGGSLRLGPLDGAFLRAEGP